MTTNSVRRTGHPLLLGLALSLGSTLAAQEEEAPPTLQGLEARMSRLERENRELRETLGAEIERLQFGDFVPALGEGLYGLGPAASKVYAQDGLSIGGYGEYLYQQRSGESDVFDALRTVVYVGYRFDDKWVVNSELEFEHASTSTSSGTTSSGGSVSAEFSYLDYLASAEFNLRAGLLLVPMGFINEMHEPTTFLSAARPETERRIIPSTWRETGVGAFGEIGDVSYRAYAITSLNGEQFRSSGLRSGRQKGNRSAADDFALVSRIDWRGVENLTIGGAVFFGDTGQDGLDRSNNVVPPMRTTILEAHAEYQGHGWFVRGLYTTALLENTATFNTNTGNNVGKRLEGFYAEAGYDVMPHLAAESTQALLPFARYERVDTQAEMARAFVADRQQDEAIWTFGMHYRPISQVAIKLDYQAFDRGSDRFQVLFGYMF